VLIDPKPVTEDLFRTEQVTYVFAEEGRLFCEQMLGVEPDNPHLRCVHRELGLAGYEASDRMDCATRQQRLALAYSLREERGGERPLESLGLSLAEVIVALDESGLAEHVRAARVHVLRACAAYDEYLESARSAE